MGYVATGLKTVGDCRVGDTFTLDADPADAPLPGYRPMKPMVFASAYPSDAADYTNLRDALAKLQLNDASLDLRAGDAARRWAMASAAVSWGCSTWRSSRSAWSASTTWT